MKLDCHQGWSKQKCWNQNAESTYKHNNYSKTMKEHSGLIRLSVPATGGGIERRMINTCVDSGSEKVQFWINVWIESPLLQNACINVTLNNAAMHMSMCVCLRIQMCISTGMHHRVKDNDWDCLGGNLFIELHIQYPRDMPARWHKGIHWLLYYSWFSVLDRQNSLCTLEANPWSGFSPALLITR